MFNIVFVLSGCDYGKRQQSYGTTVTTFDAVNAQNPQFKTTITNIVYDDKVRPESVNYNNNKILNAPSIESSGYYPAKNVVISDPESGIVNYKLWVWQNESWVLQTGGAKQPPSVNKIYGMATPEFIVLQDSNHDLWVYSDVMFNGWSKQTLSSSVYKDSTQDSNAIRQTNSGHNPPSVSRVYGDPSPSSIILQTAAQPHGFWLNDEQIPKQLWVYNGKSWNKLTGGVKQPPSVSEIVGNPTPKSIVLLDKSVAQNLWVYNGNVWKRLTGCDNQPVAIHNIYGRYPTPKFLVVRDNDNVLWVYNNSRGDGWVKYIGGSNLPAEIDNVYDDPAPNSIVLKDTNFMLWTYNGRFWTKLTGGVNQPPSLENVAGYPRINSIVFKDRNSKLWIYNGSSFKSETGGVDQPLSMDRFFGHPTESSIVISDNNEHNLWVYDGYSWSRQTGGSHQPKAVDLMFMVRQRQLQE